MKRHLGRLILLTMLVVLAMALAGCGDDEPEATATPTKTPKMVAVAPTDTPVPPTATPMLPTDTPVPPTDTPTPTETPTATPTPTEAPKAFAQPTQDNINARKGPSTSYGILGKVFSNQELEVLGKNDDGSWHQVCCVSGVEAWVSSQFLDLSGAVDQIAVVDAPELNADTRANESTSGGGSASTGGVITRFTPAPVDNPPPSRYWGLCGLRVPSEVKRPPRDVAPQRSPIGGATNPLTGLQVDPSQLQRRILLTRHGHEPGVKAYYGLNSADLVWEELMDSLNTTRFTAVWLAGDAPVIGPLRSYRSTTIQLATMYDAPIATSGAIGPNQVIAYKEGAEELDERCYSRPYFQTPNTAGNDWINRVSTSTSGLRGFMEANAADGLNRPTGVKPFTFSEGAPGGGSAGASVVVPYINRGYYEVEWRYDPGSGRYNRFQGTGRFPLMDGNNNQQVSAANVVILYVNHALTDIIEDSLGSKSVHTYLVGNEGRATFLRDGQAYEGTWRVPDKWNNIELLDGSGNPFPLKPGNTWFQIVPPSYNVTAQ